MVPSVCFGFFCLLVSSVSNFHPDSRGEGGHLSRLTCSVLLWGGRSTANKYHWRVWGVLAVSRCTGSAPAHGVWAFPVYTAQAQVALQGNCLRRALGCMHFPGLSRSGSGSQVLHKGTDSVGHAFCALPRPEQLRRPGTWRVQSPQAGGSSYHLPGHSSVTWVAKGTPVSGVLCVSSGELISGCDPPSRCQPSRIPRSLG